MGNFAMPAFGPVVLSSGVSDGRQPVLLWQSSCVYSPCLFLLSEWELIIYLFLGIACGLGGVAFIAVLDFMEKLWSRFPFLTFSNLP